jgi:enoyl-CoA hydratase/carnithine racemase
MPRAEALDLLITGRSIGYLRARSLGLVDRLASAADSAEALDSGPASEDRAERREPWEQVLEQTYERLADHPGAHPEVQRRILALVELDIERGPMAAQEEAVRSFAELAVSPETREAITWFFQRKLIPATY